MNFDRLGDPVALATGCLLWIPLAIWIVGLISWMIAGEIEPLFGLAGVVVALMMGYWGIRPPSPIIPPLLLVLATATVVLYPMAQFAMTRAQMKEIDAEAVDRAYEVLAMRRDNTGAQLRLARSVYNLGHLGHAVAIAEIALKDGDKKIFREEFVMLNSWRNQVRMQGASTIASITCVHCDTASHPATLFCPKCGGQLYADYVRGKWMNPAMKSKVLLVWLALAVGLVGFPAIGASLPLVWAIAAMTGLAVVVAIFVVLAFRQLRTESR